MMKKIKYSLTAKERKELRQQEIDKAKKKSDVEKTGLDENPDDAEVAIPKKKKPNLALVISMSAVAILLIVFAILLPLVFFPQYWEATHPIAKMELSNGMVIEMEIYENECPIASANFIYLARNKYFDDTIIFDNQNGYVRFGNYEDAKDFEKIRAKNKAYTDTLEGFTEKHKDNKLAYELNSDSGQTSDDKVKDEGALSFLYSRDYGVPGSEFQICGTKGASLSVENKERKELSVSMFGRCLNEKSLANVKALGELKNSKENGSKYWQSPVEPIKIKKVTMFNLDKKKWKNINFEDYLYNGIKDSSGNNVRAVSYWRE